MYSTCALLLFLCDRDYLELRRFDVISCRRDVSEFVRTRQRYSTSTDARIHGWIQHWNLCTPGVSLTFIVPPGDTTTTPGAGTPSTSAHFGARANGTVPGGTGGMEPFRMGTNPPP